MNRADVYDKPRRALIMVRGSQTKGFCPNCKTHITLTQRAHTCPFCTQKIDWANPEKLQYNKYKVVAKRLYKLNNIM